MPVVDGQLPIEWTLDVAIQTLNGNKWMNMDADIFDFLFSLVLATSMNNDAVGDLE